MAANEITLQSSFDAPVPLDISYSQEYKLSDTYFCDPRRDSMIRGAHPIFVENRKEGYQAVFGKDLTAELQGSQKDPTLKELKQVVDGRANKFGYGVCVGEADHQGHRPAYMYELNLNVIPKSLEAFRPKIEAQFASLKADPAFVDKVKGKLKKGEVVPTEEEIDKNIKEGLEAVYTQNIETATQVTQCQGRDRDQALFPLLGHHLNLTQNEALTLLELGPIPAKYYCFEPVGLYSPRNVRLQLTGWSELIFQTLSNLTGFRKEEITIDTDFNDYPNFSNSLSNPTQFFSSRERVVQIADSLRLLISPQLKAEKMMGKQFSWSTALGFGGVILGGLALIPTILLLKRGPKVKEVAAVALVCSALFSQLT